MAVVQGIKEKVHLPIYDSVYIKPRRQLREVAKSSTLKFFVDVQGKTKLETNLQSASLLPHYNTFEARAMRVVISDTPPEFSDEEKDTIEFDDVEVSQDGNPAMTTDDIPKPITADLKVTVRRLMELLQEAREDKDGEVMIEKDDEEWTLHPSGAKPPDDKKWTITLTRKEIEDALLGDDAPRHAPPRLQVHPNNGAGNVISKLIYNTVTTLYVGEKVMISMPTFFFPAGAGVVMQGGTQVNHGEATPLATFRFAEPIFIDKQQNFRVELEVPDNDTFKEIQRIYGPLSIWVVLDGFMTRGVQ